MKTLEQSIKDLLVAREKTDEVQIGLAEQMIKRLDETDRRYQGIKNPAVQLDLESFTVVRRREIQGQDDELISEDNTSRYIAELGAVGSIIVTENVAGFVVNIEVGDQETTRNLVVGSGVNETVEQFKFVYNLSEDLSFVYDEEDLYPFNFNYGYRTSGARLRPLSSRIALTNITDSSDYQLELTLWAVDLLDVLTSNVSIGSGKSQVLLFRGDTLPVGSS